MGQSNSIDDLNEAKKMMLDQQFEYAISAFQSLKTNPQLGVYAHFFEGLCYSKIDNHRKAIENWEELEEKYPNWREMAARDQLREFLGFDFTGRAGGKKKEGTGYVDGQSYARGNPDIQPDPKPVKEYIDSIK